MQIESLFLRISPDLTSTSQSSIEKKNYCVFITLYIFIIKNSLYIYQRVLIFYDNFSKKLVDSVKIYFLSYMVTDMHLHIEYNIFCGNGYQLS